MAERRLADEIYREKKKKKMQAFLDSLAENNKKRHMSYLTNKNINKVPNVKINKGVNILKSESSSVFFRPPVFGKKPSYRPFVRKVKYEESLLLSLKNHLTSYPTPTNLTHA